MNLFVSLILVLSNCDSCHDKYLDLLFTQQNSKDYLLVVKANDDGKAVDVVLSKSDLIFNLGEALNYDSVKFKLRSNESMFSINKENKFLGVLDQDYDNDVYDKEFVVNNFFDKNGYLIYDKVDRKKLNQIIHTLFKSNIPIIEFENDIKLDLSWKCNF